MENGKIFLKMEQELTEPPKPRYLLQALNFHFDNIGIGQLSYDFSGSFLAIKRWFFYGGIREVLTEFESDSDGYYLVHYYPFYTFIMPFGSISLGPGYLGLWGKQYGLWWSGIGDNFFERFSIYSDGFGPIRSAYRAGREPWITFRLFIH